MKLLLPVITNIYGVERFSLYNDNDLLILMVCQLVGVILCQEVRKFHTLYVFINIFWIAQSAGAVEYTDCFSAKGKTLPPPPPPPPTTTTTTKQSDGEVPVMPSLPGPPWPGVVAPDRVLSMGQTELNCVLMLNLIIWNRTVFYFETVHLC